ncbi:MAG: cytochrome c [Verrucomicrobiota bacterium]
MIRIFFFGYVIALVLTVCIFGFRGTEFKNTPFEVFDDMDHQPKYKTQTTSFLFDDGRIDRLPVSGTIPFNREIENEYLLTGKMGDVWGAGFPIELSEEVLLRGQERYNINCAVCHGETGAGNGIVTQYGMNGVANYHTDMFRKMPEGQIYNTIQNGKGLMIGLPHISPEDTWAIIAYVRVLQRSKNATMADVPEADKDKVN